MADEPRINWRTIPVSVPEQHFLTAKEVGAIVGKHPKVVREWARTGFNGFPPSEELGGVRVWEGEAIGLWLRYRKYLPKPPATAAEAFDHAADAQEAARQAQEGAEETRRERKSR